MILHTLSRTVDTVYLILDTAAAVLVNVLVIPLSLVYTLLSRTLSNAWQLTDGVRGIYYIWWSARLHTIRCSKPLAIDKINIFNTKMLLFVFAAVAPVLIISALLRISADLINRIEIKQPAQDDPEMAEADIAIETKTKKTSKKRRARRR